MRQIRSAADSTWASNPAGRNRSVAGDATSARRQSSVAWQRRAAPDVACSRAGGRPGVAVAGLAVGAGQPGQ
jgi:hypothetical protein